MPPSFLNFLRILLPTLCLCFFLSGLSERPSALYQEVFGGGDYLLSLDFVTNPHGPLLGGQPQVRVRFKGTLLHENLETPIEGVLIKEGARARYEFSSHKEKFVARLQNGKGCESWLHLSHFGNTSAAREKLLAGFCYGAGTPPAVLMSLLSF